MIRACGAGGQTLNFRIGTQPWVSSGVWDMRAFWHWGLRAFRQAGRQAARQPNSQTAGQAGRPRLRRTAGQWGNTIPPQEINTKRFLRRFGHSGIRPFGHSGFRVFGQAGKPAGGQAGRQAGRPAGRQAGRPGQPALRHAGTPTCHRRWANNPCPRSASQEQQ